MSANAQVGLRVFLDDQLSSGLGALNLNLGAFGNALLSLAQMSQTTNAALSALLPWLAALAGATADFALFSGGLEDAKNQAMNLQDALVSVQIALNATDQEMGALGQSITQIADNSIFSTKEVADGFAMLAHRGYDAQQMMQFLGQASVNLAESIGTGTVPAADLLASTMKVYSANASEAEKYASALTFAFENGIPSASDLTASLEQVAGSVELANIPLNQLIPILDYLHQNGLPGATQAATSLRYMVQSLIHPTAAAAQELAYLGVSTTNSVTPAFRTFEAQLASTGKQAAALVTHFDGTEVGLQGLYNEAKKLGVLKTDESFQQWATSLGMLDNKLFDSKGNMKDLYSVLQILGDKIAALPTQQDRLQALLSLFNVRAGSGADILLSNIGKVMPALDGLRTKMDAFTQSDGTMKNAGERAGTLSAEMKKLNTTWSSFMAQVGTPLLAPLTQVANLFNNIVSSASKGQTTVSQFGLAFLSIGTSLSAIAVVGTLGVIIFTAFGGVLAPIVGIALGVAVGIALLSAGIAAVVVLFRNAMSTVNPFSTMVHEIADRIRILWAMFDVLLGPSIVSLQSAWKQLMTALAPIMPLLKVLGMIIGGVLLLALVAVIAAVGMLAFGLIKVLAGAIQVIAGWFTLMTAGVKLLWNGLVFLFDIITNKPQEAKKAFQGMQDAVNQMVVGVKQVAQGLWTMLVGLFQASIGQVIAAVWAMIVTVVSFFTHLYNTLVGHSIIPDLIHAIISWFLSLPGQVIGAVAALVVGVAGAAAGLWGRFKASALDPLENGVRSFFGNALGWGENLMRMMAQGIANGIGWVVAQAVNAANQVKNLLGFHSPTKEGPLSDSHTWMPNMMRMYAQGIEANLPLLQRSASRVANVLAPNTLTHPNGAAFSGAGAGGSGSGNLTIPLVVDGKVLTQVVLDRATGQLRMNGMGRALR